MRSEHITRSTMKYHYLAILSLVLVLHNVKVSLSDERHQVYVVYLGEHGGEKTWDEIEGLHHSYLHAVKPSKEEAEASIIYSYKNVINGFSALLAPEEARRISEMDGVISVFHSHPTGSGLHTTRSWDFIRLLEADGDSFPADGDDGVLSRASYGKNVIVGVLDSGVWPESESFNDEGMEPIPPSWKGTCQNGDAFNSSHCNRKIIGARYYLKSYERWFGTLNSSQEFRSPRDADGHGTHASSIIGGRRVPRAADDGGFGNGTATGGAPLVRLAIYKVCWPSPDDGTYRCMPDDTLAAFDDAIADGVHVISVSIGSNTSWPYTEDGTAIGALHAVKRDIVVVCSGGNSGPVASTVTNVAPWILTVAASSIDRVFSSPLVLGNGKVFEGQSITPFQRRTYPLVSAASVEIPGTTTNLTNGLCRNGTLSRNLVRGKAVFCRRGDTYQALEVQRAGGVATVLGNVYEGEGVILRPYPIPATIVLSDQTMDIYNYTVQSEAPTATLIPARTLLGTKPAPFMADFSSRGPNFIQPNILKPDITAPGLNILAAWSEASPPLGGKRVVKYHLMSGTSMSCPHVSAAAALLKAIHPTWSSAAIRSALITTAKQTNNEGNPITDALGDPATPFEYGAGHLQLTKAADPGLVYDASYDDYLLFLCNGYNNSMDPSFNCPENVPSPSHLNYPSLAVSGLNGSLTVVRTVTNVGDGNSTYSVTVEQPPGYVVGISPEKLYFSDAGEKQRFNITVTAVGGGGRDEYAFGWFTWSDGIHRVSSPISVSKA